ncbi:hypothetical protein P7K49_014557, partial [Saguinus oedipus]
IFLAHRKLKVPSVGETWDASTAGLHGRFGQFLSAAALDTKLTGMGALLNQQSEIWKGRLAVHLIEWDLDNEPDQKIPGKRDLSR